MARTGRARPGFWKIRPPIIVGAAVTFRPVRVTLSIQLNSREQPPQRKTRSAVRPPAVTAPPTTFRPVRATLAASTRLGRAPHPLRSTGLAAAVTFGPVRIELVRTPRQRTQAYPKVRPAAFVAAATVFRPVLVRLAQSTRLGRGARPFRTQAPPPAAAAAVALPLSVRVVLAASSRLARRARSFATAQPPQAAAPTPPVLISARVALARALRRPRTVSFRTPPPPVQQLTLDQLKTRVFYTKRGPVRIVQSKVRPPAVIAHPVLAEMQHVRIVLAPAPRQARRAHWFKLTPVIGAQTVGALSLQEFGPPDPHGNTLAGSPAAAGLHGTLDDHELVGAPAANAFGSPRPRRS